MPFGRLGGAIVVDEPLDLLLSLRVIGRRLDAVRLGGREDRVAHVREERVAVLSDLALFRGDGGLVAPAVGCELLGQLCPTFDEDEGRFAQEGLRALAVKSGRVGAGIDRRAAVRRVRRVDHGDRAEQDGLQHAPARPLFTRGTQRESRLPSHARVARRSRRDAQGHRGHGGDRHLTLMTVYRFGSLVGF